MIKKTQFGTKVVKGRKMVNKPVTRKVKKIVMVMKTVKKPQERMTKKIIMKKRNGWKTEKKTR
jgi:hypothetical protein